MVPAVVHLLLLVLSVVIQFLLLGILEVFKKGLLFVFRLMILLVRSATSCWARWQKMVASFVLVLVGTPKICLRWRDLRESIWRQARAVTATLHARPVIIHLRLVLADACSWRTRRVLQVVPPRSGMNVWRQFVR